ncbi:MAG: hypothetical protein ACLFUF_02990 [Opitutales bacterium]
MTGFDENIVRDYFELNGFFVRQLRKYQLSSRSRRSDEEVGLVIQNPLESPAVNEPGFQLFSRDIQYVQKAIVIAKPWHDLRFTPSTLKSSSRVFEFLKKDVLKRAEYFFDFDESEVGPEVMQQEASFKKLLIIPMLPASDPQRSESIALLREKGVDGIIAFSTILENLLRRVEVNHSCQKSELLQLMRTLKIYDLVKDPQMQLFGD